MKDLTVHDWLCERLLIFWAFTVSVDEIPSMAGNISVYSRNWDCPMHIPADISVDLYPRPEPI
jgi:hypothetical protein